MEIIVAILQQQWETLSVMDAAILTAIVAQYKEITNLKKIVSNGLSTKVSDIHTSVAKLEGKVEVIQEKDK